MALAGVIIMLYLCTRKNGIALACYANNTLKNSDLAFNCEEERATF